MIHDINFASCYSDNIVAMKHGELIKSGTVAEFIQEQILSEIDEISFKVQEINGNQISLYYR